MRASTSSYPESVTSNTSGKKTVTAKDKLDEINQQLAAVRLKLATLQHDNKSPHKSPPKENNDKHGKKSAFHHPKLDLVMGEVVHSPYMTAPMDRYPQETFSVPKKIQELKKKHSADIPRDELPYDMNEIKHRFIDEVVNYNVSYIAVHSVIFYCLID